MPRWPLGILALSALVPSLLLHRAASAGLDPDGAEARQAALQQMKHDVLWESALAEAREASEARTDRARAARRSRLGRATGSGARGRLAPRLAAGSGATLLAPADVLVNDNASDALLDICNAEVALAADGAFLLAAWNDGAGNDQQGWATSMNGGATWIDGGAMPALPAGWRWRADPTLATAPSHGKVYYCGLADSSGASNAIGLAIYDVVNGGWLPPSFVRREPSAQTILDKEWIAFDGAGGTLYVVYTAFDIVGGTNAIVMQKSPVTFGVWSPPTTISDPIDAGRVQGARIVVTTGGDVAAAWSALGTGYEDYIRFRRTSGGVWLAQSTVAAFYNNFGTGAPGFNRPVAVYFPSLAYDRVPGSVTQGRYWVAWSESYDHLDDILSFPAVVSGSSIAEVEPNGTQAQAKSFTPGDILRGASSSTGDADYFSCALSAGDHVVVWADSFPANQVYTVEIQGPANLKLAFGGDIRTGATVTSTYFTFTAPNAGMYYVRYQPFSGGAAGGYRVRTLTGQPNLGDRARDRRDAFAVFSDNGTGWNEAMVSDSPVGDDDWLPEIAVGADAYPYVTWYDFRDDPYGGRSHLRLSGTQNVALPWLTGQRLSSAISDWTSCRSNLRPNQGDYTALVAHDSQLQAAWADGRNATPDVYAAGFGTDYTVGCPPDVHAPSGGTVTQTVVFLDNNPFFDYDVIWALYDMSHTIGPHPGGAHLVAGGPTTSTFTYSVPSLPAGTVLDMVMDIQLTNGALPVRCTWRLTIDPPASVETPRAELALESPAPNPAFGGSVVRWSLPESGRLRLTIHDLAGARVRQLLDADAAAGPGAVAWDGRDDRGRRLRPGAYFVQLEYQGRRLARRLVVLQ